MLPYMTNLSAAYQAQADLVLAPLLLATCPEARNSCTGEKEAAESRARTDSDDNSEEHQAFELPCHSLILSALSPAFAASTRNAEKTGVEKTKDGKQIIRLCLNQSSAIKFLEYSYGLLYAPSSLSLSEAFQLAKAGHMQGMPGLLRLCDEYLSTQASRILKCPETTLKEPSAGVSSAEEAASLSAVFACPQLANDTFCQSLDVLDWLVIASEVDLPLLVAHCLKFALSEPAQVLARRKLELVDTRLMCYIIRKLVDHLRYMGQEHETCRGVRAEAIAQELAQEEK